MPKLAAKPFTDRWIAGLKANGAQREYSDVSSRGLGLRITRSGVKLFRLSYTYGNERKRPTVGEYPRMTLAEARDKRDEVFRALAKGIDLLAGTAPSERGEYAFNKIAEEFISKHVEAKSKDPSDARNIVRNELIASWGSRDIRTIGRRDVHALLDKIVKRGAVIQANRVKARASKLFAWALDRGYAETFPFYKMKMPSKERKGTRVLTDAELKAIWNGVASVGYPYDPIIKLLMLLGQRRGEVAGMAWSHLDPDAATWTMPTTKNDDPFVLPLSKPAVGIIRKLPRFERGDLVFPSARHNGKCVSGFSKWKSDLDEDCKVQGWRPHDLRRTMASRMPALGVDDDTIDRIQNHRLTGPNIPDVRATYNRYQYLPEMTDALERWAAHVAKLTK